jgi:hypothetical protein
MTYVGKIGELLLARTSCLLPDTLGDFGCVLNCGSPFMYFEIEKVLLFFYSILEVWKWSTNTVTKQ